MLQMGRTPPKSGSTACRPLRWLVLAGAMALLQACSTGKPSWVEAPLVADAYTAPAGYFAREPQLLVNSRASAQLKFSYATLPSGVLTKLNVDAGNTTVALTQESYTLNAGKVARARLVLYVDKVISPGYLQIFSAHKAGADCFAREDEEPAGCDQTVASTTGPVAAEQPATDADDPTQPLRITERGFYSFDVTPLMKHRLDNNVESMIVVSAAPDPGADPRDPASVYGSFEFASKEQQPGRAHVMHQPQLLVSLTDAAGTGYAAEAAASVRQSSTDPAVASQNFDNDENLWMNGASGDRAYALVDAPSYTTNIASTRSVLNTVGSIMGKQSLVMFVNTPVQDSVTAQPHGAFYARAKFNANSSRVRSWNDGWAEPSAPALFATAALERNVPNQQMLVDTSTPYMAELADAYRANRNASFGIAATTNLQAPVTLDSEDNTRTAHGPRFVTVMVDESDPDRSLWGPPLSFDKYDSTYTRSYCNHRGNAVCSAVISARARVGQPFATAAHPIIINPWARTGSASLPYATPINIAVPTSGASALLQTDPDPAGQGLSADLAGTFGYVLRDIRANNVVGSYQGIVSTPGHNLRSVIEFENLPLPSPTLSGPAAINTAPGSTTVTVATSAPVPLLLSVADPVDAHIDDTTRWIITSSNPADTMPGEIQQSEGSTAFAVTFSGLGARTLTATSRGNSTLKAALSVTVSQSALLSQAIAFTTQPPAIPRVGSSYAVAATGGASGNPVTFSIDAASTPGACAMSGSAVNLMAAGTCTVNADQAGNASYAAAPREQQTFTVAELSTTYSGTTVPASGPGGAASASIQNGGVNCRFDPAATAFEAASVTPPGKTAPQGVFRFRLMGCDPNATVTVTTVWPQPVTGFIKRTKGGTFVTPANMALNNSTTVRFDVTDNQPGDDDPTPGVIEDPVMPLVAAGPAAAQSIPTLSEWALLLLTVLTGALGLGLRRRGGQAFLGN